MRVTLKEERGRIAIAGRRFRESGVYRNGKPRERERETALFDNNAADRLLYATLSQIYRGRAHNTSLKTRAYRKNISALYRGSLPLRSPQETIARAFDQLIVAVAVKCMRAHKYLTYLRLITQL